MVFSTRRLPLLDYTTCQPESGSPWPTGPESQSGFAFGAHAQEVRRQLACQPASRCGAD